MTTPPVESAVIRSVRSFQNRLLALDAGAARDLVNAYTPVFQRLNTELTSILESATTRQLTVTELLRLQRYRDLEVQMLRELGTYGRIANGRIIIAQGEAIDLSIAGTRATINAALPQGLSVDGLVSLGVEWNTLPVESVQAFVGLAGDGSPLATLFDTIGPTVKSGIRSAITDGLVLGKSPLVVGRVLEEKFGMGLTRSMAIARTETLRAYREGNRMQMAANPHIIRGYRRVAALQSRTCMACLALDGKFYETRVPLNEHVNGRCAMEPVTFMERRTPERERGPEWFKNQNESTQREMMGDKRYDAWKDDQFAFEDQAKITDNADWGEQATVKPLGQLIEA